jgi:hypothetical protein
VPGIAAGVVAVAIVMGCYAGLLFSLTLHLQGGLGYSPLGAGVIFAAYASGFAAASLNWTRCPGLARERLPVVGPLVLAGALLALGLIASGDAWPLAPSSVLLFLAGGAHACAFSPLAARLTDAVRAERAAHLSGLVLTASLIGQVVGVAAFGGIYLGAAGRDSADALAVTIGALSAALVAAAGCAWLARRGFHHLSNAGAASSVRSS